jgi:hypothetical protein
LRVRGADPLWWGSLAKGRLGKGCVLVDEVAEVSVLTMVVQGGMVEWWMRAGFGWIVEVA